MVEKVVVLGAGFGGVNAAISLAGKGFDVTLIDKEGYHLYKPGLTDFIGGRVKEKKLELNLSDFFKRTPVEFMREKVLHIDPEKDLVETNSGAHNYDYLILALGSEAATYGLDISKAETIYDLEGAKNIREELENTEDATIIGSGYTGIELAGELAEKGIDVTIIDQSTRPMPQSNMKSSEIALNYMNEKGIEFLGDSHVTNIEREKVKLEDYRTISADLVIWAGGIKASEVVKQSFHVGPEGLPVNSGLSALDYENVFAVGDNADHDFLKTAQNAEKQGTLVAENVAKSENQALEDFDVDTIPLVISLGNTAIFEYGDRAYKSRFFRYLKHLIRMRYWLLLRKRKWRKKLLP